MDVVMDLNAQAKMNKLKESSPFWLDDGNLMLITGCTAFKVHRGILERHSAIFRELLSPHGPPLPIVGSEPDAITAIRFHDEPKELEYFLLALYDGLHFEQRGASNFPVICGVIRLSTKYLVEHLRLESLRMLQYDWPMTLAAWDLREQESTGPDGVYESAWARPHPIYIIKLAHELGAAGALLLPAAFYDLSRYNCSHIWTGCPNIPPSQGGTPSTAGVTEVIRLSAADLHTVMVGKEASQFFIARFLRHELEERDIAHNCEHETYESGRECRHAFDNLAHEVYRGVVGVTCGRDSDPLFTLDTAIILQRREEDGTTGAHPASRACEQCRVAFAQVASAARQYVWDQLPRWFGLENVISGADSR